MAANDGRLRPDAFWKARNDPHHFNAEFHARAAAALAGGDVRVDAALRQPPVTRKPRLPAWQARADDNAWRRMRDDGGDDGRALLPGCIDALEAATWAISPLRSRRRGASASGSASCHARRRRCWRIHARLTCAAGATMAASRLSVHWISTAD